MTLLTSPQLSNLEEFSATWVAFNPYYPDQVETTKPLETGRSLPNLTQLDMSYNSFGDDIIPRLLEAGAAQSLQTLSLQETNVTNEGLENLLSSNRTLRFLDIANTAAKPAILSTISEWPGLGELQRLVVSNPVVKNIRPVFKLLQSGIANDFQLIALKGSYGGSAQPDRVIERVREKLGPQFLKHLRFGTHAASAKP